jgi:hypothetical protein
METDTKNVESEQTSFGSDVREGEENATERRGERNNYHFCINVGKR